MTPEEVAADYQLPLEAVREAIAYCESCPPEIADDFERDEARAAAKAANLTQEHAATAQLLSPADQ
jgi:hypothetical protein